MKRRRLPRGTLDIEPDRYKSHHPRFSDHMGDETDEEVHRWSVRYAVDQFDNAVADPRPKDLVFDSSGSNARWLKHRINDARKSGFSTELLWVDVPVEIALLRNRNRAVNGRWCPEKVILEKAKVLQDSFEELRNFVDSAARLKNWSENNDEMDTAKLDLHFYPAPRKSPPSRRPGSRYYGEAPEGARSPSPTPGSRRTLLIGPWKRNDKVMKEKTARLAWMDRTYRGNRERYVLEEVLGSRDVVLEPNRFPYHMPPGMEHWTIWNRKPMRHHELCEWVEAWINARQPHNIESWNYDDNLGKKTIDVWHVHIYFQGRGGQPPFLLGNSKRRGSSLASLQTMAPSSRKSMSKSTQRSCSSALDDVDWQPEFRV